tara:strand:+ start:1633 stop:2958 length:1326 start_codon:yes stop_codon:yes gene_type:complete
MKDFKYSKEEIVEKTNGNLQESEKTFSNLPQNIVISESQFERLMEQCLGGPAGFANLEGMAMQPEGGGEDEGEEMVDDTIILSLEEEDELDEIVNEAYSLINEAIKREKITILEQSEWRGNNPGTSAASGIENIIKHVKKAWDYIQDPTTKQKLENSIVKLSNFMTKTAELMAAGRDQRSPRPDSSILKDMPYPELEADYVSDEEQMSETMIDDGSDEEMEEGYKTMDHSHRSEYDGRPSKVVGVYSNMDDQRDMEEGTHRDLEEKGSKPDFLDLDKDGDKKEPMKKAAKDKNKMNESIEKEIKLMSEQWQRVVGNAVGTAFGTALANKASDKMGLGEDNEGPEALEGEMDDGSMVPGEFEVTERVLGTGISDDDGEGMISGSPENETGLEKAVDSGEFYEYDESDMMEETEIEAETEEKDKEEGLPSGDDGATDNSGQRT